jgi:hypothetical protein
MNTPCVLDDAILETGRKDNALLDLRHVRPVIGLRALESTVSRLVC